MIQLMTMVLATYMKKSLSSTFELKNWLKISFFEFAPRSDVGVVHVEAGWRRGGQGARVESWRVGGRPPEATARQESPDHRGRQSPSTRTTRSTKGN